MQLSSKSFFICFAFFLVNILIFRNKLKSTCEILILKTSMLTKKYETYIGNIPVE